MTAQMLSSAALCALIAASATILVLVATGGAKRIAGRWQKRPRLANEPAERSRLAYQRCAARQRNLLASLLAGLASGATALTLLANFAMQWSFWLSATVIGLVTALFAFTVTYIIRQCRHLRRFRVHIERQRKIATKLSSISGDHYRLFHDVQVDAATRLVDHVLIGVQGAFAVMFIPADRLIQSAEIQNQRIVAGELSIDLTSSLTAVKRLQHALSKPIGRMIRLRPVICTELPVKPGEYDNMLVTGINDIVMLQGWRTAEDALMREDFDRLVSDLLVRGSN